MIGYVRQGEDNPLPFILISLAVVTVGFFLWKGYVPDNEGRLRNGSECKRWGVKWTDTRGGSGDAPLSREPSSAEDAKQMADILEQQHNSGAQPGQPLRSYEASCKEWDTYKGVPDQPKEWIN